jgi:tetratricopeptide (TPR) repeat protein
VQESLPVASGTSASEVSGRPVLAAGLLVVLVLACWANVFPGEFVWDDIGLVVRNDNLRWSNLPRLLTGDFGELSAWESPGGLYRPVIYLTYLVDRTVWGLRPAGFHATNLAFHAAATILLFLLGRRLLRSSGTAWLTAALFAVHPVHTESVTWISGRTDVVASAFLLASLLLYLRARKGGRVAYGGSIAAAVLAMGSKETAVLLPLLLIAVEAMDPVPGRSFRERAAALYPYFLAAAVFAGRVVWLRLHAGGLDPLFPEEAGGASRVLTAGSALLFYVGRLAFPIDLAAEAEPPIVLVPTGPAVAGAILGGVLLAASILLLRRRPGIGFGLLFFLVTLFPASNLVIEVNETAAERFLYLPSAGLLLAGCALLPRGSLRDRRVVVLASAVIVLFGLRTADRNRDWRTPLVFHEVTAASSPDYPRARFKYGYALHQRGKEYRSARNFPVADDFFARAENEYRAALHLDPGSLDAMRGLGTVLLEQGRTGEAVAILERAFEKYPGAEKLAFDLGRALLLAERFEDAFALLIAAPDADPEELRQAAREYLRRGRGSEGERLFRRSLDFDPRSAEAYRGIGFAASRSDPPRFERAAEALRAAISLDPSDAASMGDLAMMLMRFPDPSLRRPEEAVALARQALSLDPAPRNYLILAHVYVETGRLDEALTLLEEGLARGPSDPEPFEIRIRKLREILTGGSDAGNR